MAYLDKINYNWVKYKIKIIQMAGRVQKGKILLTLT